MDIKFISLLALITHRELIRCDIKGAAVSAVSDAIAMTGLREISLITDSQGAFVASVAKVFAGKATLTLGSFHAPGRLSTLNVLISERNDSFSELFAQNFGAHRNFFLLILLGDAAGKASAAKVLNEFWKVGVVNVNIIVVGSVRACKDDVEMFTFVPFSSEGCGNVLPIAINKFHCGHRSWMSAEVFPQKKLRNLFGCVVTVSTFDYPPSIIVSDKRGNGLRGHEIELLNGLAKMLNFKLSVEVRLEAGAWGSIYENGSATGVMQRVVQAEVDIGIGTFYLTLTRAKFMSFIQYSSVDIILTVPRAMPLSPLEKLSSPFTTASWVALSLPLCIGFGVISLMQKFKSKRFTLQSSPHMNMLNVMLNGSQHVVPRNAPQRFILISFVTFCLIVRTMYQAGMFKFLQSDQRHAEMQTIDELLARNIDIFMYDSFQELSRGLKIHQRRKVLTGNKTIDFYQKKTLNPSFRGAAVGPRSEVIYANQLNHKNFTFRVLPEIIFAVPVAMYLPKNHFLVPEIEKCVGMLHSAGLIDYWEKKYLNDFYSTQNEADESPKILTFDHLSGIFHIWLGGCCISAVCFCFELFHKRALTFIRWKRQKEVEVRNDDTSNYAFMFLHELPSKANLKNRERFMR